MPQVRTQGVIAHRWLSLAEVNLRMAEAGKLLSVRARATGTSRYQEEPRGCTGQGDLNPKGLECENEPVQHEPR